jgi:hypothetical protein
MYKLGVTTPILNQFVVVYLSVKMGTECITEPSGAKETKGPKSVRLLDSVKKYLFVMGSCLLLFAAARNSFHW